MPILDILELIVEMGPFVANTAPRIRRALRDRYYGQKAAAIRTFLDDLGTTTDHQIRETVEDWNERQPSPRSQAEIEQICAMLINLSKGAKFLTTQGKVRSSFVRSEKLLEQLMSDIQPKFKKGELVAPGHEWRVERFLGMGSFGEVWMAKNPGYPQERAYKFFTQADGQRWLLKEQRNLRELQTRLEGCPNIIQFIDVVTNADCPFVVLEYAGGGSLEDWILEDKEERAHLQVHEAMHELIEGVADAHLQHICHRDLKPANIVLTADHKNPAVKVTDFGLAQDFEARRERSYSAESLVVGTPLYLPPEASHPSVEVDGFQADVFAIGVIWYQLLTNTLARPPYDFAEELRDHAADTHTIRVITRCLAGPENRYANADELRKHINDEIPWRDEIPAGVIDVQQVFREYLTQR